MVLLVTFGIYFLCIAWFVAVLVLLYKIYRNTKPRDPEGPSGDGPHAPGGS